MLLKSNVLLRSALLLLMMAFTLACGKAGFNMDMSSGGGVGIFACETQLKTTYSRTYFPLLSTSCKQCHSSAHGSTNLNTSFQSFKQKGVALIDYKATNPHGDNGLNLSTEIAEIKPAWSQGEAAYDACVSSSSGGSSLMVVAKAIPGIQDTQANQNQWKTVSWDLETDVPGPQQGMYEATLKIEARFALQSGNVVGLEFRNPSMRLKAGSQNLEVSGMNIFFDGSMMANGTTYTGIYRIINSATADVPLAPGSSNSLVWYDQISAATVVSLQFPSIKHTDLTDNPGGGPGDPGGGPTVTYTQLTGGTAPQNVFQRRCLNCHNNTNQQGGLNLQNYTTARNAASDILSRINNTANPMPPAPPGTLMPQADRDIVGSWVSGGTPQ